MSDKIKSEYNKLLEEAKPSEEFLSRLTETLKEEEKQVKQQKQNSRKFLKIVPILSAAACIALAVGIGAAVFSRSGNGSESGDNPPITSEVLPQFGENSEASGNSFVNLSWYEGEVGEGLAVILAEKLKSGTEYLAFNSENRFVDCEKADKSEISDIAEMLLSARPTDDTPNGETVYYMAVFTDGTIAKFSISGGKYAVISGDDTVYKIS